MTPPMIIAMVVVIGVVVVAFVAMRRRSQHAGVGIAAETPQWPDDDGSEAHVVPRDPEIRWPSRVDPRSGNLDGDARLALIKDLGFIRAPWVVPILTEAYAEELGLSHRDAIQQALAACGHPVGPSAAA